MIFFPSSYGGCGEEKRGDGGDGGGVVVFSFLCLSCGTVEKQCQQSLDAFSVSCVFGLSL